MIVEARHILKFTDNTAIVSLLHNDKSEHGLVVDEFVKWCDDAFIQLNTIKTNDMVIDFRKKASQPAPQTLIKRTDIEFVEQCKYLGTVIDHKLKFDANAEAVCRRGQQHLYLVS